MHSGAVPFIGNAQPNCEMGAEARGSGTAVGEVNETQQIYDHVMARQLPQSTLAESPQSDISQEG
jgi:hypothetical protein